MIKEIIEILTEKLTNEGFDINRNDYDNKYDLIISYCKDLYIAQITITNAIHISVNSLYEIGETTIIVQFSKLDEKRICEIINHIKFYKNRLLEFSGHLTKVCQPQDK